MQRRKREAERAERERINDLIKVRAPTVPKHSRNKPGFSLDDHKYTGNESAAVAPAVVELEASDYSWSRTMKHFMKDNYTQRFIARTEGELDLPTFRGMYGHWFVGADEVTQWLYDNLKTTDVTPRKLFRNFPQCGYVWPAALKDRGPRYHTFKTMKYYFRAMVNEWWINRLEMNQWKLHPHENNLSVYFGAWLIEYHFGPLLVERAKLVDEKYKFSNVGVNDGTRYHNYHRANARAIDTALSKLHIWQKEWKSKNKQAKIAAAAAAKKKAKGDKDADEAKQAYATELEGDELKNETKGYGADYPKDDMYTYSDEEDDVNDDGTFGDGARTIQQAADPEQDEIKAADPKDSTAANDPNEDDIKAAGNDESPPAMKLDSAASKATGKDDDAPDLNDANANESDMDIISIAGSAMNPTDAGAGSGSGSDSDFSVELID